MLTSGSISVTAVKNGENARQYVLQCNQTAVRVSAYNVQAQPAVFSLERHDGESVSAEKAWFRVRIMARGEILGIVYYADVYSVSYTLPADGYGNATAIECTAYSDSAYKSERASLLVSIVADTAYPMSRTEGWSVSDTYRNGDCLLIDGSVYVWSYRCSGNSEVSPETDVKQNPDSTHWVAYQDWPLLCTRMMMAKWAMLGSAVFNGDYMMSQYGADASGNQVTDYSQFSEYDPMNASNAFRPNVLVNWKTGEYWGMKTHIIDGEFSGTVSAVSGTYRNLECAAEDYAMSLSAYRIRFTENTKEAEVLIGSSAHSPSATGIAKNPVYVSVNKTPAYSAQMLSNIGVWLNVSGARTFDDSPYPGNHALYIEKGDIAGFRLRTRRVFKNTTLDNMDTVIMCGGDSSDMTLTLPSSPEDGHVLFIRKINRNNVNVYGKIRTSWDYEAWQTVSLDQSNLCIMIYDGVNKSWTFNKIQDYT